VINSNLPPISKLWPIIGLIVAIDMGVPHFNAPAGGDPLLGVIPCEYPDKLYLSKEIRGIVLPYAENRTIVSSFVWTQYRSATDSQTDGIALASTARLHGEPCTRHADEL